MSKLAVLFRRDRLTFTVIAGIVAMTLVTLSSFGTLKIAHAAGGGTATISDGDEGASAGVTAEKDVLNVYTIVLTVGGEGIATDAQSPRFSIPSIGLTTPDAAGQAGIGDVNAAGEWSAVAAGGTCAIDMGSVGTAASSMNIGLDVTGACAGGDTITLVYAGVGGGTAGASALTISTDDLAAAPGRAAIAASPTITVADTVGPTVSVNVDDDTLGAGDTAVVTFSFTEVPVGFTAADVDLSGANGTIGVIDSSNPLEQFATFTPTDGVNDGTNTIAVGTAWTDAASNAGSMSGSENYAIDTLDPVVVAADIEIDDSGCTGNSGECIIGDTIEFVWDATISNPGESMGTTPGDVAIDLSDFGGDVNTFMTNSGGQVWTVSLVLDEEVSIEDASVSSDGMTVYDDAGNLDFCGSSTDTASVDTVRPTVTALEVLDGDLSGSISNVMVSFSEAIADVAPAANGFDVTSVSDHGNCDEESINPNGVGTDLNLLITCDAPYTAVGDMNVEFEASANLTDMAGNRMSTITFTSEEGDGPAITDGAEPVIMSVSPEDGSSGNSRSGDIVITFSEPMEAGFVEGDWFTVLQDDTDWEDAVLSVDSTVVTLSPVDRLDCSTDYDVALSEDIDASSGQSISLIGPEDGTWTFRTSSCSSGGGSSGSSMTSTAAVVTLTGPDAGDDLSGGDVETVTWTTSGSGNDTVELSYSTDGGVSYTQIAYDLDKDDGSYDWTVPNVSESDVILKITSYDSGKGTLDTDSVTVDISSTEAVAEEEEALGSTEGTMMDSSGRHIAPVSQRSGVSPLTGAIESISEVRAGQFVRSYGFPAVYLVEADMSRSVFWDTTTFFTWADSWDQVVWVSDATLPTLTLGGAVLPKAGVVLVKIQSDPKVYAIENDSDPELRWVPTEEVATSIYGSAWADYVIDVDSTVLSSFEAGDDMDASDDVDMSVMKTRAAIAALVAGM